MPVLRAGETRCSGSSSAPPGSEFVHKGVILRKTLWFVMNDGLSKAH